MHLVKTIMSNLKYINLENIFLPSEFLSTIASFFYNLILHFIKKKYTDLNKPRSCFFLNPFFLKFNIYLKKRKCNETQVINFLAICLSSIDFSVSSNVSFLPVFSLYMYFFPLDFLWNIVMLYKIYSAITTIS